MRALAIALAVVAAACASRGAVCTMPAHPGPWHELVAASQCGGDDGSVTYRSSTTDEQDREVELFSAILRAAPGGRSVVEPLVAAAAGIGLQLAVDDVTATLVEDTASRRGRGSYVIALGQVATEMLVQIPHSFSDVYTLPLGRELFTRARARAIAFSTLHRRGVAGYGDNDNRIPPRGHADVAHDPESTFQSFTRAWLATQPPGLLVVQLHGFADRRVDADVVVSMGTKSPAAPWARAVRDQLRRLLSGRTIAVYPDDVDDLGATTNAQGRAIRGAGGRFLHVEMSSSLRQSLRRRDGDRGRFITGLATALRSTDVAREP